MKESPIMSDINDLQEQKQRLRAIEYVAEAS